jgi:hypothetical protein
MMTPEEKLELAELLEYRTRSAFDIRRDRLRAAEKRLGMWENGKFTGKGLAELIGDARAKTRAFTRAEFIVVSLGFRPEDIPELEKQREIRELQAREQNGRKV